MSPPVVRPPVEILFVGNSFTHGHCPPAQYYNAAAITDLNGTGYGGVPAIFQRLAAEAGWDVKVSIEAECGMTLRGHFENKADLLRAGRWDVVVLQELSVAPLPAPRGGDPACYREGATHLVDLLRASNPPVKIYLYETWASPSSVDSGGYQRAGGLRRMQRDLKESIGALCEGLDLAGVVPVGEAFLRAVEDSVPNPRAGEADAAEKMKLWADDNRHAGVQGSYLAAAVFFACLGGIEGLPFRAGPTHVARELGISGRMADHFDRIARNVPPLRRDSAG